MAYTLPVDKLINVKVDYHDIHGNPVDIAPGSMAWDTSDTAIVSVDVDPEDDQQARLIPSGTLGAGQVTATAKNTDGTEVISTLDVTIVAGNAVSGTITPVGEPEPIAPHAEPQHAA